MDSRRGVNVARVGAVGGDAVVVGACDAVIVGGCAGLGLRVHLELDLLLSICGFNEIFKMLDGHFNDFSLLDSAAALLHVVCRNELAQVGQTVVHPISAPLLYDSM